MPEPYYSHAGQTIYFGDAREILPQLEGIEAIVSDPPYGMNNSADSTRFSGGNTRRGGGYKHEKIIGDDEDFDPTYLLSYPKVILWGANHYWNRLPKGGCLIWLKRNDPAFGTFLSDAELAFVSGIQGVYAYRRIFQGSQRALDAGFDAYQPSAHPNQKPVELCKFCFQFAPNAKLICDPYCGSGSTLVAAKEEGISCIGIEIEERYCEVAANRLSQEIIVFPEESCDQEAQENPQLPIFEESF
jgi:DNA modification methylase